MSPNNQMLLLGTWLRRYHFLIAITIAIIVLIFEGAFLYRYFYRPFVSSKAIVEFKQQAALEQPHVALFETLTQFYEMRQKKVSIDWGTLRNPFLPLIAPPPSE